MLEHITHTQLEEITEDAAHYCFFLSALSFFKHRKRGEKGLLCESRVDGSTETHKL